jgi:hypothetical protein
MAARKKPGGKKPAKSAPRPASKPAAKSPSASAALPVDPAKLAKARHLLRLDDDAATIRRAIDYLLEHYHPVGHEEEE